MTGVMPLPAVSISSFAGVGVGSTKLGRDDAASLRLDGDAQQARVLVAAQRVGAPVPDAVHVDADAHELAGPVALPAAAGPDGERGGARGLAAHGDDPAAQNGLRPERIDQPEVVLGQQRGGERGECSEHDIRTPQFNVT